ncbi:hypothetical protein [Pseudomonas sp. NFR16]|uniref:hypothetical protein n=1 Tax=Pseudomonas sp. NFR16 TaxID=1566248 RepID=UPI0008CCCF7D|nr:hypothetical protein [Pseudomonas sp. NFR16]SEI53961.1 hypothetical protein SAMN03159495_0740 [Pseudomonas sp. NFR16]
MTNASERHIIAIASMLRTLRKAVEELEQLELHQVEPLRGNQTVDSKQSLTQCFSSLQASIEEIEDLLATVAEATGDIGKL